MKRRLRGNVVIFSAVVIGIIIFLVFRMQYANAEYDISGSLHDTDSYGYSRSFANDGKFHHVTVFKAPVGEYEVFLVNGYFKKSLGMAQLVPAGIYSLEYVGTENWSSYDEVQISSGGDVVLTAKMD